MLEHQAISARWRVLSRKYAANAGNYDGGLSQAATTLTKLLINVLWVSQAQISDTTRNWRETIREKARAIIEQCRSIQKVLGEDIVTCDFKVICPSHGTVFSSDSMDNDEDESHGYAKVPDETNILCTTQLGLAGRERLKEVRTVMLLKAKVLLELKDDPETLHQIGQLFD